MRKQLRKLLAALAVAAVMAGSAATLKAQTYGVLVGWVSYSAHSVGGYQHPSWYQIPTQTVCDQFFLTATGGAFDYAWLEEEDAGDGYNILAVADCAGGGS